MILVLEVLAVVVVVVVIDLPRHGAVGDGYFSLRGCGGRLAPEVETSKSKSTGHDSSQNLQMVSVLFISLLRDIFVRRAPDPVSHPSSGLYPLPGWHFWRFGRHFWR